MTTRAFIFFIGLIAATITNAATYDVGPGQPLSSVGAVPWATLQAGDTVRIHYRPDPYREKWVICSQGTAAAPITVSGVPGPAGEVPVIDGANAVTVPGENFWSEVRGVLKIGGANVPACTTAQYVVVEGLDIRGGRATNTFTDRYGATVAYQSNASSIYVENCIHCTIRNNVLHDSGNPLFVASSDTSPSRDILVQGNYIYDGGNVGSIYEHNIYTAAIGITFEYNWLGRPLAGSGGNNLKDRSAGTLVRYNWIEGGNRQMDLVDGEDSSLIRSDPTYHTAKMYGNILVEYDGDGNRQMVHYGGDSGTTTAYRKGTLYCYNNTFISLRTDRSTYFRASTNDETIDARNNIFYASAAGNTVSLMDYSGVFNLSHNWIKTGWVASFSGVGGAINDDGTMVQGTLPGFVDASVQDYHLAAGAAVINKGGNLNPLMLPQDNVVLQYVKHRATEPRPSDGVFDIGAYEYGTSGPANQPPTAAITASPTSGVAPLTVNFSSAGSFDPDGSLTAYAWNFGDGGTANTVTAAHTFSAAGTYNVQLQVTDNLGATGSTSQTITVSPAPLEAPVLSYSLGRQRNVTLSWTNPSGATSFQLERQQGTGSWQLITTTTKTSYSSKLAKGTYQFRVQAIAGTQVSPYSNTVTVVVQ